MNTKMKTNQPNQKTKKPKAKSITGFVVTLGGQLTWLDKSSDRDGFLVRSKKIGAIFPSKLRAANAVERTVKNMDDLILSVFDKSHFTITPVEMQGIEARRAENVIEICAIVLRKIKKRTPEQETALKMAEAFQS